MKHLKYVALLLFLLVGISESSLSQNCELHHQEGDCRYDLDKDFEIYSQSKSVTMSPLDTVEMNVVFYGQKDYMLSFCTHRKMYPIHFVLIDSQTGDVLYDNETDRYLESLGVGFDVTKPLSIKINVLARESTEEEVRDNVGCVGLLIQYKNYPKKKQLRM